MSITSLPQYTNKLHWQKCLHFRQNGFTVSARRSFGGKSHLYHLKLNIHLNSHDWTSIYKFNKTRKRVWRSNLSRYIFLVIIHHCYKTSNKQWSPVQKATSSIKIHIFDTSNITWSNPKIHNTIIIKKPKKKKERD